MYDAPGLRDLPWYQIAGNHDHYGDVTAQLELSNYSNRWKFPHLYYDEIFYWTEGSNSLSDTQPSTSESTNGTNHTLHIIFIDTIILTGLSPLPTPTDKFPPPPGPADLEAATVHYTWLEDKLHTSQADYIWVVGHYPIYSVCWQGGNVQLIHDLKPLLEKYEAHYMVSVVLSYPH